jgi:hypothetical protein
MGNTKDWIEKIRSCETTSEVSSVYAEFNKEQLRERNKVIDEATEAIDRIAAAKIRKGFENE